MWVVTGVAFLDCYGDSIKPPKPCMRLDIFGAVKIYKVMQLQSLRPCDLNDGCNSTSEFYIKQKIKTILKFKALKS
jgi:hypothetical protein